ncbi:hypothetical protein HYW72_00505 [Candidatus Nomurabacteria bacterium]|nr:hypothetical protein [Candidatus Nomurabacteria bacterium]
MRDSTKKIIILIDKYITEEIKYKEFYDYFNDIMQSSLDIDDEEAHLEWDINDRLAYATDDPVDEEESKKYGYIGAKELRDWLKEYKQKNIHFWEGNNINK